MRWSLRVHGEEVRIEASGASAGLARADASGAGRELHPAEAAFWLDAIAGEPPGPGLRVHRELLSIVRALHGGVGLERLTTAQLRDRVAMALRARRLRAFRTSRPIAVEQPRRVEPLGPDDLTAWIALKLRDEDGHPIADERYRIETADGRVIEGTTDGDGRAREEGLSPGECNVTFPGRDASSWWATRGPVHRAADDM
jgi:hypothetical protein